MFLDRESQKADGLFSGHSYYPTQKKKLCGCANLKHNKDKNIDVTQSKCVLIIGDKLLEKS